MRMLTILLMLIILLSVGTGFAAEEDHSAIRKQAQKKYRDGNYKDAFSLFKRLCLEVESDPRQVGADMNQAWQSLQQLNRLGELDKFREQVIARHANNWRLLMTAAQILPRQQPLGFYDRR